MPKKRPAQNGPSVDSSKTDLPRPAVAPAAAPTANADAEWLQQAKQKAAPGRVARLLAEVHHVFQRAILLTGWLQRAKAGSWPAMTDEKLADFRNLLADVCDPLTDLETRLAAADQEFAARVPPWQHLKMDPLRQLKPAVERVFIGCRKLRAAAEQPNAHEWNAYCSAAGEPLEFLRQDLDGYKCQEVAVTAAAELGLSRECAGAQVVEANAYFIAWRRLPTAGQVGSRLHGLIRWLKSRWDFVEQDYEVWKFGRLCDVKQRERFSQHWGVPAILFMGFDDVVLEQVALAAASPDYSAAEVETLLEQGPSLIEGYRELFEYPEVERIYAQQDALEYALSLCRRFEAAVSEFSEWTAWVHDVVEDWPRPFDQLVEEAIYENQRQVFGLSVVPPRIHERGMTALRHAADGVSSAVGFIFAVPAHYWRLQAILERYAPDLKRLAPSPNLDPSQPFDPIKSNALEIQNRMADLWSALKQRLADLPSATDTTADPSAENATSETAEVQRGKPGRRRKCDPNDERILKLLRKKKTPADIANQIGKRLADVELVIKRLQTRLTRERKKAAAKRTNRHKSSG